MPKHHNKCTCPECEASRDTKAHKSAKASKRATAYAKYVGACQQADAEYKRLVKLARDTYEQEVTELNE